MDKNKKCTRCVPLFGSLLLVACIIVLTQALTPVASPAHADSPIPAAKPEITERPVISGQLPLPSSKPRIANVAVPQDAAVHTFDTTTLKTAPRPGVKPIGRQGDGLSRKDAALYRQIFRHQTHGEWDKADALIDRLSDFRLRGHVLFQRYMHPTAYRSTYRELRGWLDLYADHPGADRIYKLALARMPANARGPLRRPENKVVYTGVMDVLSDRDHVYETPLSRSRPAYKEVKSLKRQIRRDLGRGAPTKALGRLRDSTASAHLDSAEYDQILARIARGYMMAGKLEDAWRIASESAGRSGVRAPLAGWVGGLVAWRQTNYQAAAGLFENTAQSPYASSWTKAAGSYWASRAHMRAGNVGQVRHWLEQAAAYPRTFYGLIATRALGWDYDFNWAMPTFEPVHRAMLNQHPAARRAILLTKAGQYNLAEQELRQIDARNNSDLQEALLALVYHMNLPSYALRLAETVPAQDGKLYDAALYPAVPWEPENGYTIDRALIHAFIRQESRFNPLAENNSGATGLMQIMPRTADYVQGRYGFNSRAGRHKLKAPAVNLDIGQRYIEKLLKDGHVGPDLFSLVIAYNAGPGNLRRWKREFKTMRDDPLLFVESIPMGETRAFVERVMANYWIYRLRFRQPTPSLDDVARGDWARYVSLDGKKHAAARSETREPRDRRDASEQHTARSTAHRYN